MPSQILFAFTRRTHAWRRFQRSSRCVGDLFARALKWRTLGSYRPDFDSHPIFQGRTLFGDCQRFIRAVDLHQEIAADSLLRLGKGTIGHTPALLSGNDFALMLKRMGAFDFPVLDKLVEPGIPLSHDGLDFFRRQVLVPLRASE